MLDSILNTAYLCSCTPTPNPLGGAGPLSHTTPPPKVEGLFVTLTFCVTYSEFKFQKP